MKRILHMIRKEFLQIFSDRAMLSIIFGMPIIQLFVLGYAITTDVRDVTISIHDMDRSQESRMLIDRFLNSKWFRVVQYDADLVRRQAAIDSGDAFLIFSIPEGFGANAQSGRTVEASLVIDGVDSNTALIAAGYARTIIMRHFQDAGSGDLRDLVRVRAMYNPALESRFTIVPGIIALLMTIVATLLTALGLVREREIGTLEQLNVTPIHPIQLILGKIIPFAVLGAIAFGLSMTVAIVWFQVPMVGNWLALMGFTGLYLLTSLVLGMFVSTVTSTQQQALFLAWFILIMSVLMSGFMFPISNMPKVLQYVTYAIPLRYYITALREIMLKGTQMHDLMNQLIPLAGICFAILGISAGMVHKRN